MPRTRHRSSRAFKDTVFGELERIGKAVGNRRRLELLDLVSQGPRTVEELAGELGVSVAVASQHLQKLKHANLVSAERDGTHIYYSVAGDDVADLYAALRRLAQARLPGLRETVHDYFAGEHAPAETIEELLEMVRRGEAVIIDTRPTGEFRAGHVAGAMSVPFDEVEERLSELPRDRRLIAHCRGPYCSFAEHAVEQLRSEGFDAVRVDLGISDFRRLDVPVESEAS
jgi:rhodanese-related sulfurtransferase/DNA-binding transcriptional ArsR family regulator